jgi:hypothetical protein
MRDVSCDSQPVLQRELLLLLLLYSLPQST